MPPQPNNASAGTQVVSLVEVRGTNNSLLHPRGAVGVVTRTPAVAGERFLVRFPDGFEASFTRDQFDVLKHFKARLGAPDSASARADLEVGAPLDLESVIIYRCVVGSRTYPLLFATISGAHLYGFPSPDSDFDLRGAHVLPLGRVIGLESPARIARRGDPRGPE